MEISSGTRIGAYEIAGQIGSGGMGDVYRARDTELDRDVAIKVLPESFASDTERVARFEQEAKTLAALNHPNIAHIYGIERTGSSVALVMELIEGPTLADRIAQGPLPADEALGLAMQIADAIEAAHERNIIHRDLKPANIKLRHDSTVKVLDFGIAKALTTDLEVSGAESPVLTTPVTQAGVILGTAAYMSPEQARGRPVDKRTDVWAFGCVLYEMLTGQLAFGGEDVAETLARVIANDTDLDSLPAAVSPAVQRTLELCLQKDVRKRVRDIGDVKLAIEGAFETGAHAAAEDQHSATASDRRWLPFALAAFAAGAAISGIAVFGLATPDAPAPRIERLTLDIPAGEVLGLDNQSLSLAISRDGSNIVFSTTPVGNEYDWYLRTIDDVEPRPLRGPGPRFETPFFSPDGRWIGFNDVASGALGRIPILGGPAIDIAVIAGAIRGASWGANDEILFGAGDGGMRRVAAGGG